MQLVWRSRRLFSAALLLIVSGLFSRTATAQLNELDPKAKAGLASSSQAPPDRPRASFINCLDIRRINNRLLDQVNPAGSPNPNVSRFHPNDCDDFEYSYLQRVNFAEHADQTDDSSTQVLAPLPIASAPSQVLSAMLVDTDAPGAPRATPPLPDPPKSSDEGWHFGIAPYLWFAGVHGTVGARGHEASVDASFRDVFSYLNIGLMFALEPRYNRIVMPLDFMWMKLSDDKALPFEVGPTSVKVEIKQILLTQKIGYRVTDSEKLKVDGLAGFRYLHLGNTLTLQPQIGNSFYASANWVDAVGGARIQAMLSPRVTLTVLGDAGGGGANSDYQVAGLLGWKFKKFSLQGGWRYMSVNYRPSGGVRFVYDMATSGSIFGATIPLK
jgi:hypothetical protein